MFFLRQLLTQKKHLPVFGLQICVRSKDTQLQIKFACPNTGPAAGGWVIGPGSASGYIGIRRMAI